jgi:hypothetical protein
MTIVLVSKICVLVRRVIERKKRLMDVSSNLGFAQGTGPKNETFERLFHRQPLRKMWTTMSLVSLALGFSVLGILIIVNRHRADLNGPSGDSFVAVVGGIGGLVVGIFFLFTACLHWSILSGSPGGNGRHLDRVATA